MCPILLARKGVAAHVAIVESYLSGLEMGEEDHMVIFDLLPNRPLNVVLLFEFTTYI